MIYGAFLCVKGGYRIINTLQGLFKLMDVNPFLPFGLALVLSSTDSELLAAGSKQLSGFCLL